MRSPSRPATRRKAPKVIRYALITQVSPEGLKCRSLWMAGSATLTTVASSTVMAYASRTTPSISQRRRSSVIEAIRSLYHDHHDIVIISVSGILARHDVRALDQSRHGGPRLAPLPPRVPRRPRGAPRHDDEGLLDAELRARSRRRPAAAARGARG